MKITLTRALAELKTLNKRIEEGILGLHSVAVVIKGDEANINKTLRARGYNNIQDFKVQQSAKIQSITDLIKRYNLIKTLLSEANNTVMVKIWGEDMTITNANIYKHHTLQHLTSFRRALLTNKVSAETKYESLQQDTEATVLKMFETTFGVKDKAGVPKTSEMEAFIETMRKAHGHTIICPDNLDKSIEELKQLIEEFELNIDFVLSEANSTNFIEIPD